MRVETPEQWAKRVAAEIRRGQLEPDKVPEQPKEISKEAVKLAIELGRERAASKVSLKDNPGFRHYMINTDED